MHLGVLVKGQTRAKEPQESESLPIQREVSDQNYQIFLNLHVICIPRTYVTNMLAIKCIAVSQHLSGTSYGCLNPSSRVHCGLE